MIGTNSFVFGTQAIDVSFTGDASALVQQLIVEKLPFGMDQKAFRDILEGTDAKVYYLKW